MQINMVVQSLYNKYKTRDPFEFAEIKNINVSFVPLGSIKGYYSQCYRQKYIRINDSLDRNDQCFTCAHELGHAILHPNSNTPFLRSNTLLSVGKLENEANYFAMDFLYDNDYMLSLIDLSIPQIANYLNVSTDLIAYRLNDLLNKKSHMLP